MLSKYQNLNTDENSNEVYVKFLEHIGDKIAKLKHSLLIKQKIIKACKNESQEEWESILLEVMNSQNYVEEENRICNVKRHYEIELKILEETATQEKNDLNSMFRNCRGLLKNQVLQYHKQHGNFGTFFVGTEGKVLKSLDGKAYFEPRNIRREGLREDDLDRDIE